MDYSRIIEILKSLQHDLDTCVSVEGTPRDVDALEVAINLIKKHHNKEG